MRRRFDRKRVADEPRASTQPMTSSRHTWAPVRPQPTSLSDGYRPRLSQPFYDNPILQSTVAFSAAVLMGVLTTISFWADISRLAITGLALGTAMAGLLVLIRSTARRRIAQLHAARNELRSDIVQGSAYLRRLPQILDTVASVHLGHGSTDTAIATILDGSAAIISGTRDESCQLALIRTAQDFYHVDFLTGSDFLGLRAGKSCPSDRPLDDVLDSKACPYFLVHFRMSASSYGLALLSETGPSEFDRQFVEGLAAAISLMPSERSPTGLHRAESPRRLRSI